MKKMHLPLQCNYKQLQLNFSTINELSLVIYGYRISEGWGGLSRKIMEIPVGWGSTMKPLGMEMGGGGSYWKKTGRGWISSGSTQFYFRKMTV